MSKIHLDTELETAKRLNISRRHLINLRNKGVIDYVKIGGCIRYNPVEVDKAIARLTVKSHIDA